MLELARELIEIRKERAALSKKDDKLKERAKVIEAKLSEEFINEGISNIGVDGMNVILVEKKSIKCDQSKELESMLAQYGYVHVFNKPVNPQAFTSLINKDEVARDLLKEHYESSEFYSFSVSKK